MAALKNDVFIRALLGEAVPYTPIWIMRQAGRYLPEYRKVREKAGDFLTLCKTPSLACEVTLQPIKRFPLDAAIIFSDILTIPDAMGLGLHFETGEGPKFQMPIRDEKQVRTLKKPDCENALSYVAEAISLTKTALSNEIPLIGFAGSPWTLACYMIEGGSSKNFSRIKEMMYASPECLKRLLVLLTESIVDYLQMQINAGVDAVMVFDSWGGILSPAYYEAFSLHYLKQIRQQLVLRGVSEQRIPSIVFSKGVVQSIPAIAKSGYEAMGLDWTVDIAHVKGLTQGQIALQGNVDPGVLFAPESVIAAEVKTVLQAYGQGSGHVFNLGHGIWPDCSPDKLAYLIETVHEQSRAYH